MCVCMRLCKAADLEASGSPAPAQQALPGSAAVAVPCGRAAGPAACPCPRHLAVPSSHHVPQKAQRLLRRLWLVGGFRFSTLLARGFSSLFGFSGAIRVRKHRGALPALHQRWAGRASPGALREPSAAPRGGCCGARGSARGARGR